MPQTSTSKVRHIPLRRCVACRESKAQKELIRFFQTEQGWQLDKKGKSGGRGAWLCQDDNCHKEKTLRRFFKQDAARIKEELEHYIQEHYIQETETRATGQESRAKRIRVATGGMNV